MIEAGANEIPEAKMIEANFQSHEVNQGNHCILLIKLLQNAEKKNTLMKAVQFRKNCLQL